MSVGDTVTFQTSAFSHPATGVIVARTYGRGPHRFDVRDERGVTHQNVRILE